MSKSASLQRAMNVLVVDDSKSMRHLIGHVLREQGHRALTARDADSAFRYLDEKRIDLILLDVEMPGMDGFEFTRELRSRMGFDWVPVVFLSSTQTPEHVEKGIQAGGDDYLGKPLNPILLKAKLHSMGRINEMRRELVSAQTQLASYNKDPLTGVLSRNSLVKELQKLWREAQRGMPFVLVRTDLVELEVFNHREGIQAGDEQLRRVAFQMLRLSPGVSVLGRIEGDEFLMAFPGFKADGEQWWRDNHEACQVDVAVVASVQEMDGTNFDSLEALLDFTAAQVSTL